MNQLSIIGVRIPTNSLNRQWEATISVEPFQQLNIHLAGGIISAVNHEKPAATTNTLSGERCIALPGFIDLHVHGGMGADTMDATPQALNEMALFFAQHGVTGFCPTTMTAPHDQILAAVKNAASAASGQNATLDTTVPSAKMPSAKILGVHVEGPYISPLYPGAQLASHIRPPSTSEFRELLKAGPISMITLAPEESGAQDLIQLAREEGVIVVIGHTNATYDECMDAVSLGATQATHTFNAMSGLHHRNPGTLGAVLSHDAIDAQLIADNIHVHPAAMKILSRCKGIERTLLITDAMRAAGLEEGEYTLGGQAVTVQDGACRLEDGTLAGSILTMEQGLRNFMRATGLALEQAWPATSRNAARVLGLADRLGTIGEAYWGDLVLLDEMYQVVATIIGGEVAYLRDSQRLAK